VRGSALLVVGAALRVVALCFAAAVAVYALRQSEQAMALPPAPVEVTPSPPVEELERTTPLNKAVREPVV
jgi:hypothetical protein